MVGTKIFISYKHADEVGGLVERLVTLFGGLGFQVSWDKGIERTAEHVWDEWQEEKLKNADRILIVLGREYRKAWDGEDYESGAAREAQWIQEDIETIRNTRRISEKYMIALTSRDEKIVIVPPEFGTQNRLKEKDISLKRLAEFASRKGNLIEDRLIETFDHSVAPPEDLRIRDAVNQFKDRLNTRTKEYTESQITNTVGRLCERYGATSAWLFLREDSEPNKLKLHRNFSHNVPMDQPQEFEFCDWQSPRKRRSVAGYVAKSRRPYCIKSDPKKDPFYKKCQEETRSELAVPILAYPDNSTGAVLLGVLNLESKVDYSFVEAQKGQLQAEVFELGIHLLVWKEYKTSQSCSRYCWHPECHSWELGALLEEFCTLVSNNFKGKNVEEEGPFPSCTIWYANPDPFELYVRGTSRFDYEYIDRYILPGNSFTGRVTRQLNPGQVAHCSPNDGAFEVFKRRKKADSAGLIYIFSAPIHRSPRGSCPNEHDEKNSGIGAINLYFFHEDRAKISNEEFKKNVARSLSWLATEVSKLVDDCIRIKLECGLATAYENLYTGALPGINDADILRDTILRVLNADGCSIFCRKQKDKRQVLPNLASNDILHCIATSGLLKKNGEPINPEGAFYDWNDKDDQGLTVSVAKARRPLRKSSAIEQSFASVAVQAKNKFRESFSLTESEHRPFMGVHVPFPEANQEGDEQGCVGVIRLVRTSGARPFTYSEEKLLSAIAKMSAGFFVRWGYMRPRDDIVGLLRHGARFPFTAGLIENDDDRNRIEQVFRLGAAFPERGLWTRRYIDSILLDLVDSLKGKGAFMASLRIADRLMNDERNRANDGCYAFRMFSIQSLYTRNPMGLVDVYPAEPLKDSLAHQALKKWMIVAAPIEYSSESKILDPEGRASFSMCIPLVIWNDQGLEGGVLTVYFEVQAKDKVSGGGLPKENASEEVIRLCFFAAQKLMIVGRNNRWSDTLNYESYACLKTALHHFLEGLVSTGLVKCCDVVRSSDFGDAVAPEDGDQIARSDHGDSDCDKLSAECEPLTREPSNISFPNAGNLVQYKVKRDAFMLKLLCGPFDSEMILRARLSGKLERVDEARRMHSICSRIFHQWQRFSRTSVGLRNEFPFVLDIRLGAPEVSQKDSKENAITWTLKIGPSPALLS